jgi:signal transduction histidine kinase
MPGANEVSSVQERMKQDCNDRAVPVTSANEGTSLSGVLEGIAIGVVIVDSRRGVTEANAIARRLLCVTSTEGNCLDNVHRAMEDIGLGELLLAGSPAPTGSVEFEVKNKQDKILKVTSSIVEADGASYKIITITDNTLKQQYDEGMTEFIASISHELRTPLTTIQNSVSNILAGVTGKVTPKTTQYLENMLKECSRLAGLVNDLLDMAKIESGKISINRQPVDVAAVLLRVVDACRPLAMEKNLELHFSVLENVSPVYIDSQRIHQVFINLLKNAMKYTDSGGKVIVHLYEKEDNVVVVVEDTGIGIPSELTSHIFNKFYHVARKTGSGYQGVGLGLAICKGIMAAHNGKIWVESVVGKGSKFYVALPRTDPEILLRKHLSGLVEHVNSKGGGFAMLRAGVKYKSALTPQLSRAAKTLSDAALAMKHEIVCGVGDLVVRTGEDEVMIVLGEIDESFLHSVHQRLQKLLNSAIEKNSFSELPILPITKLVIYPNDGSDIDKLLYAIRQEPLKQIVN